MQTQAQQVIDRCKVAFAKAKELYNLDLSMVSIRFDLKGAAAGMACARGSMFTGRTYYMRFNRDMMQREAFDHVLNNTVPHEVAHIVCFMNPLLGRNHDAGWERVCRALGGSGATRHQEDVVYGKGRTFEYTTTAGHKVRLSEQRHNGVQRGGALSYRGGKGIVNKSCAYEIVGYQGRTLTTPIPGKAAQPQQTFIRPEPTPVSSMLREIMEETKSVAPNPAPVRPAIVPAHTQTPAARPVSIDQSLPKSEIARRLIMAGYKRNDSKEVVIGAIIAATGMARSMACNYFKNGSKQLCLPASFYA